jgi:hypothetical protein
MCMSQTTAIIAVSRVLHPHDKLHRPFTVLVWGSASITILPTGGVATFVNGAASVAPGTVVTITSKYVVCAFVVSRLAAM